VDAAANGAASVSNRAAPLPRNARCIMAHPDRKIAFVPASSDPGAMIVNRFDYYMIDADRGFGVSFDVLNASAFDGPNVELS
jgi:hypothetical protein